MAQLVPIAVPDFTTNVSAINVESVVFFDEHARAGRMKEARNGGRPSGRLIPAVEYLRSQRVRMMMMEKLAEATANVDVYVVAANPSAGGGPPGAGRRPTPRREPRPRPPTSAADARRSATSRWRTWPATRRSTCRMVSCETGSPTNVTFYGRPFGEMEVIALAKAYQDAAGLHLEAPGRGDRVIE